jgi:hypothetical protein
MLPIWLRYYVKEVGAEHLWVLDHNTVDGSTAPEKIPAGVHLRKLYGEAAWMPHYFLNRQVELHQQRLFRAGYKCVLFTEIDEIVVPDPAVYPGGLKEYFKVFINMSSPIGQKPAIAVNGHHLSHAYTEEPEINISKPILQQRKYWFQQGLFSKPLLSKVPLRYNLGHHEARTQNGEVFNFDKIDPQLIMVHLHSFDNKHCVEREKAKYEGALRAGKKDEATFGMNYDSHSGKFDDILKRTNVCGLTMLQRVGNEMHAPLGDLATTIPQQFLSVEI